jgi:hypothetical protein
MKTPTRAQAQLVEVIADLATKHSARYIAEHLNLNGIPTISGRGRWSNVQVERFTTKHGIGKPRYNPIAIADAARAEKPANASTSSPVSEAAGAGLAEPSDEDIANAKAYLEALTPEQTDYLSRIERKLIYQSIDASNEVADLKAAGRNADGSTTADAMARIGALKADARALSWLIDALASGDQVKRAAWAHHELLLMPLKLDPDALLERRLVWLHIWTRMDKADAEYNRKRVRQERDPKGYRLVQLRQKLKVAQERREHSTATLDAARATGKGDDRLLGKHIRRRAKADDNIQAMIDEIERLEAET